MVCTVYVYIFNKASARIAALLRCITQPPVEPGAVGTSPVNIERDPASAGNAVVLGQKKHRESTATLSFPQLSNLSRKKKATNARCRHLRRVVNRFILGGTKPLPSGFDVSATAEVARSCCRLTAVVVVSRLSRRALTGSHKEWSPASLTLLAKQTLTKPSTYSRTWILFKKWKR